MARTYCLQEPHDWPDMTPKLSRFDGFDGLGFLGFRMQGRALVMTRRERSRRFMSRSAMVART